jgi:hypothetical protein
LPALQFLHPHQRKHAGGATDRSQVSGETDSMRRKASLQTLPNQEAIVVQTASAQEPERPDCASEQAVDNDLAVTSDNARSDDVPADQLIVSEPSLFSSLADALGDDRGAFLQVLDRVVDGGIPPAVQDALAEEGGDPTDESVAFEKIIVGPVADRSPLTAVASQASACGPIGRISDWNSSGSTLVLKS